jgi:hypothetical protein
VDNANATIGGESYVTSSPALIKATVMEFLHGHEQLKLPVSVSSHGHHAARAPSNASLGLYPVSASAKAMALTAAPGVPFTVEYPSVQTGPAVLQEVHVYKLEDQHKHVHHAYVAVWQQNGLGGYYDVEGMDWVNIPLFTHARTQMIGGRSYLVVDDGSHIHDIGWRVGKVMYFISNTLLEDLSNAQMIAIARSTHALQ